MSLTKLFWFRHLPGARGAAVSTLLALSVVTVSLANTSRAEAQQVLFSFARKTFTKVRIAHSDRNATIEGSAEVTAFPDGNWTFVGDATNLTETRYDFSAIALFAATDGETVSFLAKERLFGVGDSGNTMPSSFTWNQVGQDLRVARVWTKRKEFTFNFGADPNE